jgi:hypothetical protein
MEIRFHMNPATGQPHLHDHGVSEEDIAGEKGGHRTFSLGCDE